MRIDPREVKPCLWCAKHGFLLHVLDISRGEPAAGLKLLCFKWSESTGQWVELRQTFTFFAFFFLIACVLQEDERERTSGQRASEFGLGGGHLVSGWRDSLISRLLSARIRFETADYFALNNQTAFFPYVEVVFVIADAARHYHIPLTLSNYGYSTYKGQ
ncbi:5-hydroxyisourate hydrolase [Aphelenchoides fujianensis]|nr:5-hydroxyisourate hydrolase [Aphelenchoides fujianensis]